MNELCCWNCGESVADVPLPISRHANCKHCFEVLHCCRMCRLFDTNRPGSCDEDRAEPPAEKEVANFCEFFMPVSRFNVAADNVKRAAGSKLDALFGSNDSLLEESADDSAKSRLEDLFKD